jgi:hypothetical protein
VNNDLWSKLDRMQELPSLLTGSLKNSMIFIFRLGWMVGGIVFAVGTISFLSGIDVHNGKRMIFRGFLLFRIFLYLGELPPNKLGGFCPPRLFCLANTVGHMQPSHRQFGLVHGSPRPSRDT